MKILVTRPVEDSEDIAQQLHARGHQVLIAPLMTLRFLDGSPVWLDDVQAILATSANGIRALARRTVRRDVAVFAVGPQTAAAAQKLGFRDVKSADGNAQALAEAAMRWAMPDKGVLFHAAGEGNDAKLTHLIRGFAVRQEILYSVTATDSLTFEATMALRHGEVDAALFFSPRSAEIFRLCAIKEDLAVKRMTAACISAATAETLAPLIFARVCIAARPHQAALLALLDEYNH